VDWGDFDLCPDLVASRLDGIVSTWPQGLQSRICSGLVILDLRHRRSPNSIDLALPHCRWSSTFPPRSPSSLCEPRPRLGYKDVMLDIYLVVLAVGVLAMGYSTPFSNRLLAAD